MHTQQIHAKQESRKTADGYKPSSEMTMGRPWNCAAELDTCDLMMVLEYCVYFRILLALTNVRYFHHPAVHKVQVTN